MTSRPLLACRAAACALAAAVLPWQAVSLAQDDRPLDPGVEERVEIHYVLIDFLVIDGDGRTIPDVRRDELKLKVGGKKTVIETLDVDCPAGDAPEPLAGADAAQHVALRTAQPAKIVLVFDYFHMDEIANAIAHAEHMLDRRPVGDEEHMVISMGRVLRVEVPMTSDVGEARWGLERMRNDPDLYFGHNGRATEYPFFDRLQVLMDMLERWPGRKSVVLFSGPLSESERMHDGEYKKLSSLAGSTRTAFYPVDAGGMRTYDPYDPRWRPLGGPMGLRRLANETGGRMTADTNDIGLAYAKARRDIACTYTLGFESTERFDKSRRVSIEVKGRGGVQVVHPEFHVVRSNETRNASLRRTATQAPHMFESDEVRAELFVMGPDSYSSWRTVLALDAQIPVAKLAAEAESWDLRGTVRKPNGTIVRSFKSTVALPPAAAVTGPTFGIRSFETLKLPPGRFIVSAMLIDPDGGEPVAATRTAELVPIPEGSPFVIGPLLGHRSADSTGIEQGNKNAGFEPLVVAEAEQGGVLESLTRICVVGASAPQDLERVDRSIHSIGTDTDPPPFESRQVQLPGNGKVYCHSLVDTVPTTDLAPGRYELSALAEMQSAVAGTGTAEFTILPSGPLAGGNPVDR